MSNKNFNRDALLCKETSFLTFLLVLLLIYCLLNFNLIFSKILIADDNIFHTYFYEYPKQVKNSLSNFIKYNFYYLIYNFPESIIFARFKIILIFFLSIFIIYKSTVTHYFKNKKNIFTYNFIIISALTLFLLLPNQFITFIFVNGNYATVFLLSYSLSFFLIHKLLLINHLNLKFYIYLGLLICSLSLSLIAKPLALINFSLFYFLFLNKNIKSLNFYLIFFTLAISIVFFIQISSSYHYISLGWFHYDFSNIPEGLKKIFLNYIVYFKLIFQINNLNFLIFFFPIFFILYKFFFNININNILNIKISVILFFLFVGIVSLIPLIFIKISFQYRYFFFSDLALCTLFTIGTYYFLVIFKKFILLRFVVCSFIFSIIFTNSITLKYNFYKNKIKDNILFHNAIRLKEININSNFQYIFFVKNFNTLPSGFNHWSTGYLRYIFDNKQLTGLITMPQKKYFNYCPMIKQYFHHSELFWSMNTEKKYRKKNIGIVINKPTKLFEVIKINDNIQINEIYEFFIKNENQKIFKLTNKGVNSQIVSTNITHQNPKISNNAVIYNLTEDEKNCT